MKPRYRLALVPWSSRRKTLRLLPGCEAARLRGCLCKMDNPSENGYAIIRITDACPLPRYGNKPDGKWKHHDFQENQ